MKHLNPILLIFLITLFSSQISADPTEIRRSKIIEIINEELDEVSRLNRQTKGSNPQLLFRIAELNLEKGRLVREKENKVFLKYSPKKRSKINKKRFFRKSEQYFYNAKKVSQTLISRFKNFKNISDAYVFLAYYEKERGHVKKAEKLFKKSISLPHQSLASKRKSMLSLAGIYYNKLEYNKAISLYEKGLKGKRNRWYTKDSFNLAWAYFRVGKTDRAISKMKSIYKLSKKSSYVDMRKQIERDLAYFYAADSRINEAIAFYKKMGRNVSTHLILLGKNLKVKSKYTVAERVFKAVLKLDISRRQKIQVAFELLEIYDKFSKRKGHLAQSRKLLKEYNQGRLDTEQKDKLIYHLRKKSSSLQKSVTENSHVGKSNAKLAVQYFKMLSEIENNRRFYHLFLSAETYYAAKMYNDAILNYDLVLKKADPVKDKKTYYLALEGMLSSLERPEVSSAFKNKYITVAYKLFLRKNPKSKKSFKIYQALFKMQIKKNQSKEALLTLMTFTKYYPRKKLKIEAMAVNLIDHYRKNKNHKDLFNLSKLIDNRKIYVSAKTASNIKKIILNLQFSSVEKSNSKGDKKIALKGYLNIFKDKDSTKYAMRNAAYNVAVLFYELGDARRMYDWTSKAIELMTPLELKKFEKDIFSISLFLFNRRKFSDSATLSEKYFNKTCKLSFKTKDKVFKNAIIMNITERKYRKIYRLLNNAVKCKVSKVAEKEMLIEMLYSLTDNKKWGLLEEQLKIVSWRREIWSYLIYPMSKLQQVYLHNAREKKAKRMKKKIIEYYKWSKQKKQTIELESLDVVVQFMLDDLNIKVKQMSHLRLKFPEKIFNVMLQKKFKKLDQFTNQAVKIIEIGSGNGIVSSYKFLVKIYTQLINEIENFTPKGKSKDYLSSFKKGMKGITGPLRGKVYEFQQTALGNIKRNNIMSMETPFFTAAIKFKDFQFTPLNLGFLMDKGGGK